MRAPQPNFASAAVALPKFYSNVTGTSALVVDRRTAEFNPGVPIKYFVRGVIAALMVGSAGAAASAADLPHYKAPPAPPPPAFTWTGLYGGVNIGYAFGASSQETGGLSYISAGALGVAPFGSAWTTGQNLQGVVGGGQLGYNYQFNPWLVLGAEADIQAADIGSHGNAAVGIADAIGPHLQSVNSTKKVDWFGTVRGRVGLTLPSMPNLMVYGTGGFAYGQVVHNVGFADNYDLRGRCAAALFGGGALGHGYYDDTKVGRAAGGGLEWSPSMFPAWSLKAEYLYVDLGNTRANSVPLNGGVPAILGGAQAYNAGVRSDAELADPLSYGSRGRELALRPLRGCSAGERDSRSAVDQGTPAGLRGQLSAVSGPLEGRRRHAVGRPWRGLRLGPASYPGLGSIGVLSGLTGGNGLIAGASTNTSTSIIPMLDAAYFLTKNWAIRSDLLRRAASHSGHRHDRQRLRPRLASRRPSWRNIISPISTPCSPMSASA